MGQSACTSDESPAILGNRLGFQARVKEINPDIKTLQCMIYPYALTSETLPPELRAVLDDVVKMLNAIKSSAFNTRSFRLPCQEFGATTLLF